jgi:hypothetical protein
MRGRRGRRPVRASFVLIAIATAAVTIFATPGVAASSAPGITANEIKLGVVYNFGTADAQRRLGITLTPNVVDLKQVWQIMIDDQNSKGGINGRMITPVFQTLDASVTGAPIPTQEQAMCTALTQDTQVFAVTLVGHTDNIVQCLSRAGAATIGSPAPPVNNEDDGVYKEFKHYVSAGTLSQTTLAKTYPKQLMKMGFLTKGSKVGVVSFDTPTYTRAANVLLSSLKKQGFRDVQLAQMGQPTFRAADAAAVISQEQGAVLRFKTAGIDRVIFLDSQIVSGQFMIAAEPQEYRPRYAISSNDGPVTLLRNVPPVQFNGTVGLSWYGISPTGTGDVSAPPPLTASATACESLLRSKGAFVDDSVLPLCQEFNVFAAAMKAAGKNPTVNKFVSGYESLGKFPSPTNMTLDFSKNSHAGVAALRWINWDSTQHTWVYTSPTEYPVPRPSPGS